MGTSTTGDGACTAAQIKANTTLTAYTCATEELCNDIEVYPELYKNVVCCAADNCNSPMGTSTTGSGASGLAVSFVGIVALMAMLL
eukprot:TRINITY_DN5218_c0_g1_i2.p1 TRINITY_DN5218_c0_g1~~TRINITY_DN5218_c0_g1_i2.p1  ORF type:complete len:86 (-),score=36.62 TRINITY_DN5218_c0_g1_i2:48-305(-)